MTNDCSNNSHWIFPLLATVPRSVEWDSGVTHISTCRLKKVQSDLLKSRPSRCQTHACIAGVNGPQPPTTRYSTSRPSASFPFTKKHATWSHTIPVQIAAASSWVSETHVQQLDPWLVNKNNTKATSNCLTQLRLQRPQSQPQPIRYGHGQ